jgi:alkanesulfonate monooxygenase SsuD/methylene tetrahydromethanopterin reductase-like flavin-dependent oxidoreductase (luciferase family)
MVTNVAIRNPGVLAKSILTVDQISGGRVDAVLGGGFYPAEHAALGIDFLDGARRSERLREAVAIILDGALRGDTVTLDGAHFRLSHATFRPTPTQQPRPPLWVAAQAPRSLLVAVEYADAVVSLGEEGKAMVESLPVFRRRMETLDEPGGDTRPARAGRGGGVPQIPRLDPPTCAWLAIGVRCPVRHTVPARRLHRGGSPLKPRRRSAERRSAPTRLP